MDKPMQDDADQSDHGLDELNRAYDGLEDQTPDRVARAIRWLRDPKAKWVRIPLGVTLILLSFGWFLPVVGVEWLPLGLLLLAQDVPFLRKPVGRAIVWLECQWVRFRAWRLRRRR